ncbi:YiiX family permuted papain-like enzyme [Niastella populi]|uniref:Peptidoglycan peptidase n=1 Tax=Niastella populi TaxID=550983 RepID=A0A1V9EVR9_9BACT|nr:YiiX family permuted papain-like enzyme [Niastella populi]OQP50247.1 peptidoglycan peptidase [Niastella populi]
MRKLIIILGLIGLTVLGLFYAKLKFYDSKYRLDSAKSEVKPTTCNEIIKNGDIIFQTSLSGQSKAIQLATKSKYSHCGLIFKDGNDFYVFEAVQPVKWTPLNRWIARGQDGRYVIKRLKNADQVLTFATLLKMKQVGNKFNGKNYDLTFEWSDEKIYCSELIWKIYQRATGIEIGKLQKLSDFDLTNEAVKKKMKERYGDKIPLDEIVISPEAIFDSELLITVKSN